MYIYVYAGLEINVIASQYAIHFQSKCESLLSNYLQYFWLIANQFEPIVNNFC